MFHIQVCFYCTDGVLGNVVMKLLPVRHFVDSIASQCDFSEFIIKSVFKILNTTG